MEQRGKKTVINLSNSRGRRKYRVKNKVNSQSNQRLPRSSSRRNVRAKVVKNPNSLYVLPQPARSPKPVNLANRILNNIVRVTVVGVGMGILFGTFVANRDLTKPLFPQVELPFLNANSENLNEGQQTEAVNANTETVNANVTELEQAPSTNELIFSTEDTVLKQKFNELKAKYPQHEPSAFFMDLDNGVYVNFNGIKAFPAASTIKIPVLVAFLQDVDAGKIYLDEKLKVTKSNNVSGSGSMQYRGLNREYSAIYTATEMIISSDNTATEMIIERLGGREKLNQRFKEWGLESTVINNPLPDLAGTNTTSARDLATLLGKVNQGQLISIRSRDRLMDIMTRTKTRTLLPKGVERGTMIAHKTGDIGKLLGDAGIIDMPTGKRYVGAVLVSRPHNDYSARTLIQKISREVYQHFKWYQPRNNNANL